MLTTCLCLTRNRREWLPKAIDNYRAQAHSARELLIVADSQADVEGIVPLLPDIRIVYASGTIGSKRNVGCAEARGEVIAVWDDDDYSAPDRLADQIARLQASGKAVTGYQRMKFTDGRQWWMYEGNDNFALGTSLCFTREWWAGHPFKNIQVGEDNQFVAEAWRAGELVVSDAGELMYANMHAANTSPKRPGPNWRLIAA